MPLPRIACVGSIVLATASFAEAQCLQTEITSPEPSLAAAFGSSMASSGGRVLVGSTHAAVSGVATGAAFLYELGPGGLVFTARLAPADHPSEFGCSVALDGDRAIVGAERDGLPDDHGSAYVFERAGSSWIETAKLLPPANLDFFGHAVALSGTRAAVSVFGGVFVYELVSGTWTLTATVIAPPLAFSFGDSIELEGDTLLVGATEDFSNGLLAGAVYVYQHVGGGWSLVQPIASPLAQNLAGFGADLSLDGDRLAVLAKGSGLTRSAVYVFERTSGTWSQTAELFPDEAEDQLGLDGSIALEGPRLLFGLGAAHGVVLQTGAAVLYELDSGVWTKTARLDALDGSFQENVGSSTAIVGDWLLAGAAADDSAMEQAGSMYAFRRPATASTFCHCDDPLQAPCANGDSFGGCRSSAGQGAMLSAWGTASVAQDDLVLQTTFAPANKTGLLLIGSQSVAALPFGNGLRCVGGQLFRFPAQTTSGVGCMQQGPGLAAYAGAHFPPAGSIQPGSTWNFQSWFRDPLPACASNSNASNAVAVAFLP